MCVFVFVIEEFGSDMCVSLSLGLIAGVVMIESGFSHAFVGGDAYDESEISETSVINEAVYWSTDC